MTMARQDPGGLNAATSTGMVAHGATNYNLNYYGVTADTPQNYGSMITWTSGRPKRFRSTPRRWARKSAAAAARTSTSSRRPAAIRSRAARQWSITGKGYWDHFTGSNITDDLRAQGVTDPTLRNLNDFNADAGGPFLEGSPVVVRIVPQLLDRRGDALLHGRQPGRQPDQPVRLEPAQLHGERQVSGRTRTTSCRRSGPTTGSSSRTATPGRRSRSPINTLHQESPKNLINANWTSVMGQNTFLGSVVHLLPHALAEHAGRTSSTRCPASQQRPSTFNVTTGIYLDGPEPTGQRLRDAYRHQTNIGLTRYIDGFLGASHQLKTGFENWWTPTGTDGFVIFDDSRLRYTGAAQRLQPDGENRLRPVRGVPLQHAAHAGRRKMRNFAGFVQDRASYQRVTLNLGLRWSYFDGNDSGADRRRRQVVPGHDLLRDRPRLQAGARWRRAPASSYKLTEDGKNVAKASYSRYYESMYTSEFNSINPNSIQTGGVADLRVGRRPERQRRNGELTATQLPAAGVARRQVRAASRTRSIPT